MPSVCAPSASPPPRRWKRRARKRTGAPGRRRYGLRARRRRRRGGFRGGRGRKGKGMTGEESGGKVGDGRWDRGTGAWGGRGGAVAAGELGGDLFGDDPTANRLQATAAAMLGFEQALLFPSGT